MRVVVFLDLFATLVMPASLIYLIYLIYYASTAGSALVIEESLYLFAAIYGCQAIIFLLRRKWDMIGWMVIYILSLPIYAFFLPLYAFWHFDDFSWGNTRLVVGDKSGGHGGGGAEGEVFDEKSVKKMTWEDYNLSRGSKKQVFQEMGINKTVRPTTEKDIADLTLVRNPTQRRESKQLPASTMNRNNSDVEISEESDGQYVPSIVHSLPPVHPMYAAPRAYPVGPVDLQSAAGSLSTYSMPLYGPVYPGYGYPVPYAYAASSVVGYPQQVPYGQQRQGISRRASTQVPRNMLPPASPLTPTLQQPEPENLKILTQPVKLVEGVPTTHYPLPANVPVYLARVIIAEVRALVRDADLRVMTKKKVRERVNANINRALEELEGQKDAGSEVSGDSEGVQSDVYKENKSLLNDLLQINRSDIDVNLNDDLNAREWVNRCIVEELKTLTHKQA
jgi:hypothetical protein